MKIVVLAGGVGAARFLEGLVQITNPIDITVIVNTGDDEDFYGLRVCPDIDTILYTLSGNNNEKQGWGLKDETFAVSNQLGKFGYERWFMLGDKDFATHIHRTNLLQQKKTLSEITENLAKLFSLPIKLLPMSNDVVKTKVKTPHGILSFQEYFVKRKFQDTVLSVIFSGIKKAKPAPGVIEAINIAEAIIIAPSNPIVSIGTILAVPTITSHIKKSHAKKIAISPIIGGKAIKGPADIILTNLGIESSAFGVANIYKELLDTFILDAQDRFQKEKIEKLGMRVVTTNTIMKNLQTKKLLAQTVINTLCM